MQLAEINGKIKALFTTLAGRHKLAQGLIREICVALGFKVEFDVVTGSNRYYCLLTRDEFDHLARQLKLVAAGEPILIDDISMLFDITPVANPLPGLVAECKLEIISDVISNYSFECVLGYNEKLNKFGYSVYCNSEFVVFTSAVELMFRKVIPLLIPVKYRGKNEKPKTIFLCSPSEDEIYFVASGWSISVKKKNI